MPGDALTDSFRTELRQWLLEVERPENLRDYGPTPTGDDVVPGRAWQRLLAEAGWACIAWPIQWGGRDATLAEQAAFVEECATAGVPRQMNIVGPDLVGPVLLAHGTDQQRAALLPRIRTGDDLWCQLFSEPDAGSDLASIRTKAQVGPGGWIVDGAKLWSSGANSADMGLLLARTGDDRLALSMFAVPMTTPGIEVRPLRQMDGQRKFNEVRFDHVVVDEGCLLGAVGDGWKLALSTLGSERLNLGAQSIALFAHLDEILEFVAPGDALARQGAAALWTRIWLLRANFERLMASGRPLADPSYSMLKLAASELQRDLYRFGVAQMGPASIAAIGGLPATTARFLGQPGQTIAGGTSEIQRNILGERVLGLPR
jgi:alkylation response protein AidB-like acyl-CoA dehydrogenase